MIYALEFTDNNLIDILKELRHEIDKFNKGLIYTILASLWWGILGVIYFRSLSFVGYTELVLHRVIWTFVILLIATSLFSKWKKLKKIIKFKNNLFFLCISGILIFSNQTWWG